ncbi:type II toxin-antitoxin system RelE/ParE family toxin [Robiginitomaculum antarcticum]|uniref:type II toxin-antitoxin system RelE/ParE family toxin n=1 Tax=Robiginitomaculum antarcticum TaxID=437507 RepID=UPI00036E989A|nr:type II toxin-antitoxin system RelE/ParE family toxin [Robiginitomaculum antarcticum]
MREFIFSVQADLDFQNMLRYGYVHWGETQTNRFLETFLDVAHILLDNPKVGRSLGKYRIWPIHNYLLEYSFDKKAIYILRIIPKGRPR